MFIEDVKKLSPEDRFWYWIRERHQIYLRRKAGKPKPWTDDEILQQYFFTNPFRENDKVTVWFRENIREPLRNDPRVLMATIIFRWFNLPYTGEQLLKYKGKGEYGALDDWNSKAVISRLSGLMEHGAKIFTGAFTISPGSKTNKGRTKLDIVCNDYIQPAWDNRDWLIAELERGAYEGKSSLQEVHELFTELPGMGGGGFMAYEAVTDLRHTYLLDRASDINSWANPGPGCIRGLARLNGESIDGAKALKRSDDWLEQMRGLLKRSRKLKIPSLEMREIEHSLCEFDKYERILWGQGKSRRKFEGRA